MKFLLSSCCFVFIALSTWAQTKKVTGQVIGSDKEPVIGAAILEKGTNNGTQTDIDGNFTISVADSGNPVLVISYVGMKSQEIPVAGQSLINVTMEDDSKVTEEVVVVGYGTVKKSDLTGAVSSLKPDDIKQIPASNVVESIQGKAPGVDIVRTSGSSATAPQITIRGNRSVTASNNPLYIVDGMQYSSIQDINPNDIVSMEVLKDASSTAIYGSRGSNGVIIVTTKRGTSGDIKVSINSYVGQTSVLAFPQPMSPEEYLDFRRQGYRTAAADAGQGDNPDLSAQNGKVQQELTNIANGKTTNYLDELLRNGVQRNLSIGIAGGTDKLKTYFSLDYFNEQGMLRLDNLTRYTGRINLDYQLNKFIKVGTQTQVTNYDQTFRVNPVGQALSFNPLTTPFRADGSYDPTPTMDGSAGNQANPLIDERVYAAADRQNTLRVFPTIFTEIKLLKGLTARLNYTINTNNDKRGTFYDAGGYSRWNFSTSQSRSDVNTRTNSNWQAILNYGLDIKKIHSLNLTALNEIVTYKRDNYFAQGEGQLVNTQTYYNLGANTQNRVIASSYEGTRLVSFAGRANYAFMGKYLLTATGRFDGASQLSEGNKWDFFPSIAAGWRISDENFMKNVTPLSTLKLRASWGVSGNASVGAYGTQSLLYQVPYAINDSAAIAFRYNSAIGNKNLAWEKSKTIDIGLDVGLLKERITLTADYYTTTTTDLILDRTLPTSSGVETTRENVGRIKNKGIELALSSVNISKSKFTWTTTFTFTKNSEKIEELAGGQSMMLINDNGTYRNIVVGAPVSAIYNYEKVGIWQLDEQEAMNQWNAKNPTYQVRAGDIKIKDQNGDGKIDAANDRVVVGSRVPKWSGGLNNEFKFYNFDVSLYLFARIGQTIDYQSPYDPAATAISNSIDSREYWTPENPTNDLPRPGRTMNTEYRTTINYKDGTFYKLRNFTIGYTIPSSLTEKWKISRLRVYVTGKNVFVWSKIKDFDPEMGSSSLVQNPITSPSVRLLLAGVNLEF